MTCSLQEHYTVRRSCCKGHASCAGTALAAAILVPNVEFIFGLLGSTASVMIAYMLPAALFLSLSGRPALLKQLNPDDVTTGTAVLPLLNWNGRLVRIAVQRQSFKPLMQCCRTISRLAVGAQPAKSLCAAGVRPRGGHPMHESHPAGQHGALLEHRACRGVTGHTHVALQCPMCTVIRLLRAGGAYRGTGR
jgi:hypothetical protein